MPNVVRRQSRLLSLVALIALVAALAGCGSDDKQGSSSSEAATTDAAFLKGMIPHHESAVEMAKIAKTRAQHKEIKDLAASIVKTQNGEIKQMEAIYMDLFGKEVVPDPGAHEKLGLSAKDAGMDHMEMTGLARAKPFDRAFIDGMVPHHQGAIRMARIAGAKSDDKQVKRLATSIISAQSREIEEMNAWRTKWYGSASAAGGVPTAMGSDGSDMKNDDDMKMERSGH